MTNLAKAAERAGLSPEEAAQAIKAAAARKHAPPEPSEIMDMAEVASYLGAKWSTRRVRERLVRKGIAYQDGPGGRWYITRHDLKVALRNEWLAIELAAAAG